MTDENETRFANGREDREPWNSQAGRRLLLGISAIGAIVVLVIVLVVMSPGSPSSPAPSGYVSYNTTINSIEALDGATLKIDYLITNTGNASGSPTCDLEAGHTGDPYHGYDVATTPGSIEAGASLLTYSTITITNQGAQKISQSNVTVVCSGDTGNPQVAATTPTTENPTPASTQAACPPTGVTPDATHAAFLQQAHAQGVTDGDCDKTLIDFADTLCVQSGQGLIGTNAGDNVALSRATAEMGDRTGPNLFPHTEALMTITGATICPQYQGSIETERQSLANP